MQPFLIESAKGFVEICPTTWATSNRLWMLELLIASHRFGTRHFPEASRMSAALRLGWEMSRYCSVGQDDSKSWAEEMT